METFRRSTVRRKYEADIVVSDPDGLETRLIVEVKAGPVKDLNEATRPLREAMLWVNCHNALLVTADLTYVYRDTFHDASPDAIQLAAEQPLSTTNLLGDLAVGRNLSNEEELARVVVAWLQALSTNWQDTLPADDEIVSALLPEIIGAIAQGQVQCGTVIWYE